MIFAERDYDVKGGGKVRLAFYEPSECPDGFWKGRIRIDWPSGRVTNLSTYGLDKLDALLTTLSLARINMETYEEWQKGNVSWLSDHDLGLEVHVPPGHEEWANQFKR